MMLCKMLKFLSNPSLPNRVYRVLAFSTSSSSSLSSTSGFKPKDDSLYYRLVPAWRPSDSVIPILDQWVSEAKTVNQTDIKNIIKQFRSSKRYSNALQICEWLGDIKIFDLTPGDVAVRLHLISKVHGVEKAEEYVSSIPESLRGLQVYGALLQCYAEAKDIEKAECIMQKMRGMGQLNILPYNVMMSLYSKTGKFDKMNNLIKEVEEKGTQRDRYSYNIQLQAFVSSSDIKGMENLIMKMEIDPLLRIDWRAYSIVAKGYMKAGETQKASAVLKKFEHLVGGNKAVTAYQFLMTQYALLGKKQDVYRIFHLLKKLGKFQNHCYMCMLSSLEKLDDLEGAEKIFEEWMENNRYFDMKIPNMLVTAYCKKGQVEKAELFIKLLTDRGIKPNANTWFYVARSYLKCKSGDKAVEIMKKTILEIHSPEEIDFYALAGCLEYLNKIGDVTRAEELIKFTEEHNQSSVDVRSRIMEYINKGNLALKDETLEEDTAKDSEG